MNKDQDAYWDRLDDFLDGQMSKDKRTAMQRELDEDAQLQADLALQKQLRDGIAFGGGGELRQRLQRIHQETQGIKSKSAKVVSFRSRTIRWAAVAAVLVLGLVSVLRLSNASSSPQDLYAQYYSPYEVELTQRGEAAPAGEWLDAYRAGNYEAARPTLALALEQSPKDPQLQLALAIAEWQTGETVSAMQRLEQLQSHPILGDQASWYAGLYQLQVGNVEAAKAFFGAITSDSGKLFGQSQEILSEL